MTGTELNSSAPAGAIRNPANPAHFMVIKPVKRRIRVYAGNTLLADTTDAVRILETGKTAYDPVIYVPKSDLSAELDAEDRNTHCPLKGDAAYFSLGGEELSWSYPAPFPFAMVLKDRHAFWPDKVRQVEGE